MTSRRAGGDGWRDSAAGPLVRPYAMTRGRTRAAAAELDRGTLVVAVPEPSDAVEWDADRERILLLCAQPRSIADLAAALEIPVVVAKVLVSDLLDEGDLSIPLTPQREPDHALLQAVLDGIRRL
ncbi:DUF742 domain-containing protein [Saccharopolyspora sp. NPDC047091]|uniref:DUF742 domain-containing protein n=1 Tax=Saccharopolyspora sp. NPDC047091 TaxID=3155924 RepID=UPI0033E8AF56